MEILRLQITVQCPRTRRPANVILRGFPTEFGQDGVRAAAPCWCSNFGNVVLSCPGRCLGELPEPTDN